MNIAFFLLPKEEVVYINENCTIRQALEKMEYHRYSAVPILDDDGKYIGTLTEGDLLWKIKNTKDLDFETAHKFSIEDINRRMKNECVRIDAEMIDLISLAKVQNFVPVVDDMDRFIGIVRRSDIIEYCSNMLEQCK